MYTGFSKEFVRCMETTSHQEQGPSLFRQIDKTRAICRVPSEITTFNPVWLFLMGLLEEGWQPTISHSALFQNDNSGRHLPSLRRPGCRRRWLTRHNVRGSRVRRRSDGLRRPTHGDDRASACQDRPRRRRSLQLRWRPQWPRLWRRRRAWGRWPRLQQLRLIAVEHW